MIRSEAEINYYVSQVEVISYIESMLLGDPFNFLSNWPTFVWLRRFPSCRYVLGLEKSLETLQGNKLEFKFEPADYSSTCPTVPQL